MNFVERELRSFAQGHLPALFGVWRNFRDRAALDSSDPELNLLPRLCQEDEVAFDVGANIGQYSFWLLKSTRRVMAFEPNPLLARILRMRFRTAIQAGRLRVECAAASDRGGTAQLCFERGRDALASIGKPATGARIEIIDVATVTLDHFDEHRVGFIKIDVEGHESAVLEGARGLLRRDAPTLLIEAEERHRKGAITHVRGMLEPLGYRGFYFHGGWLHPAEGFNPSELQRRDALNEAGDRRRTGRPYINNFIFIQRPEVIGGVAAVITRS